MKVFIYVCFTNIFLEQSHLECIHCFSFTLYSEWTNSLRSNANPLAVPRSNVRIDLNLLMLAKSQYSIYYVHKNWIVQDSM